MGNGFELLSRLKNSDFMIKLKSFILPKNPLGKGLNKIKEKFGIEGEPVYKGILEDGRMVREYITPNNELVVFQIGNKYLSIEKYLPKGAEIQKYKGKLAELHKRYENNVVVTDNTKHVELDRTVLTGLYDEGMHSCNGHVIQTTDARAANIGFRPFKDNPSYIEELRVNRDSQNPYIKKRIPYEKAVAMGIKV